MQNKAIEIENVSLKYKCLKKMSIKDNFFRINKDRFEVFEALKGVSFDVKKGEILGIVGKNGSGKSTILRAIANIFSPDEGKIDLYGNSVALMSIGVGFQNKLTGRENIYLSGLLLGFEEEYINKKMKEIIDFSELKEFIDKPVKTYSSGMYSKLAFSITAVMKTDIILIDEVLSVGDAKFKKKSYAKMRELISDRERTVVLVSHNSELIRELCSRVVWLHDGRVQMVGETEEVMDAYEKFME